MIPEKFQVNNLNIFLFCFVFPKSPKHPTLISYFVNIYANISTRNTNDFFLQTVSLQLCFVSEVAQLTSAQLAIMKNVCSKSMNMNSNGQKSQTSTKKGSYLG